MTNESFYLLASPASHLVVALKRIPRGKHSPLPGYHHSKLCVVLTLLDVSPFWTWQSFIPGTKTRKGPSSNECDSLTKHSKVVNLKSSPGTDRPRTLEDIVCHRYVYIEAAQLSSNSTRKGCTYSQLMSATVLVGGWMMEKLGRINCMHI